MSIVKRPMLVALLIAALSLAAGCGGDDGGGEEQAAGGIASEVDLSGATLTVGSKEFTEQLILGQMTIQALEAAGAEAKDQTGLEGSVAARRALTSGEIDMYWEYTGTAWVDYLNKESGIPDEERQYEAVKKADAANGIAWLEPTPMNNTYAFAIRSDTGNPALEQVETISDLGELLETDPELVTLCVGEEFATRPDGLPGVEKAYGFEIPKDQVSLVGDAVVYDQVAKGDRCNFGSVFSTDGRIEALNLRVLEDDQNFFPFFNAALTVRKPVLEKYPQLTEVIEPIAEALTDEKMTELNARVDVEGETPREVASDFLEEEGIVEE